jgi:hypothetical protein
MAYWQKRPQSQIKPSGLIRLGDGENTAVPAYEIARSESSESRNTSSRKYPALSTIPGVTSTLSTITTPNAAGVRNNEYAHVQDGTVWKRWDGSAWQEVAAGLANAKGKFVEFNTEAKRYTVLMNGTDKKAYDGTTVTDLTDAPETNLICVDDFRIYALKGSTLSCSAESSVTDWTTVNSADSFSLTGMVGEGTAIATYNDTVIAWSEQTMHVVYGNDPYDFYPTDPMSYGCISDKSVLQHEGKLYFLGHGKYYAYTGGKPAEISQKVRKCLEGINTVYKSLCAAGKHGKYIYLSIPYGTSTVNNLTLEYDTEWGKWYVRNVGYSDFFNIGEYLYGITPTGTIYRLNTGDTTESWYHITGVITHDTIMQKKVLSNLWLSINLPIGSTLTVSYSTAESGDFTVLYTFTASASDQNVRVQVPTTALQNIDKYRLKFEGTGPCEIHYMEECLRIKGR